ncbi:ATP-binding protein [Ruminococcus sp.]|uniref:VirB4 family type IV secretion system protein n=1 Tax=Ruminococcus sp. TaxID=41978 RepID=UPI0025D9AD54|nr:ATP-binding protein [Ruminococcus sp.]
MSRKKAAKTKTATISYSQCLDFLINVKEYCGNGLIKLEYKNKQVELACVMQISGIDIFHYSEEDIFAVCNNFARATNALNLPHKYIFSDKHPDLEQQLTYLEYKSNKSQNFSKAFIDKQIAITKKASSEQRDRLAYLIVYAKEDQEDQLIKACQRYISHMTDTSIKLCSRSEISYIFRKHLCCADHQKGNSKSIHPLKYIKHQGYAVIDGNYVTSLIVNDYPATIKSLELASIIQQLQGITVMLDVDSKSKSVVLKELKNSMKELRSRFTINRSDDEDLDTQTELDKLTLIRENIKNGNEQMLYITLRIIISETSLDKLNDKCEIISQLLDDEGISCFVPFNEMTEEYINLIRHNNIANTPFPLHDTYKMQYPFYYQQHLDDKAFIFGKTRTGGLVAVDFFARDSYRQSFDMMFIGVKGSGKSATLKSLARDYISLGNKIMVLDIESEYAELAKMFGGQVIRLNKNSTLNVLQLRKTIDSSREDDASNETNYASELSRIITFFYQYAPSISEMEAEELKDVIQTTFLEKGITESTDVSLLAPEQFPIFSDVLHTIRHKLYGSDQTYNHLTPRKIDIYEKLETIVKQLAEGIYASMFNGYSNVNIDNSNLIVFDVKSLSDMDERIYNAQLFNILTLMWSETCQNVAHNNAITNPFDRRYVISLIDEAHRFINSRNPQVTDFIEKLVRRTRKYDASLWFASQSISDFNPSGSSEGAEKIRVIFQLVQYKLIFKQSSNTAAVLHEYFPQFTMSELNSASEFEPGEMLMSLGSGRNKLHCKRYIDDATMLYIGNSRDREEIIHHIFEELYNEFTVEEYAERIFAVKDHFHKAFTDEVFEVLGYKPYDSDMLYNIVYNSVGKLIDEYIGKRKEVQ